MTLLVAKNSTVTIEPVKEAKKPLGKWLIAKNGKAYMNIFRAAPNRESSGGSYKNKPAWVLQAFENKTDITFTLSSVNHGRPVVVVRFILSYRNKKDGSRSFYFKRVEKRGENWLVRHTTPYRLRDQLFLCKPKCKHERIFPKAWAKRIKQVVDAFIVKHHANGKKLLKYFPADPFDRIFLCVYPGYEMFKEAGLSRLPMTKDAKSTSKNFVGKLLKTNGNVTRRLLVQAVKDPRAHGVSPETLFFALKHIRRLYGLDRAVNLITPSSEFWLGKMNHNSLFPVEVGTRVPSHANAMVKQFEHYSYKNFVELFDISSGGPGEGQELSFLCRDTKRMIFRAEGIPIDVEHKSLQELHDALIERLPPERVHSWNAPKEPKFACYLASGDFAKEIEKLNPEWEVIFPSSQEELSGWSRKMHNCISAYSTAIWDRTCDCVAIVRKSDQKMLYNLEIARSKHGLAIVQFKGRYNTDPISQDCKIVAQACENAKVILSTYLPF
jgi:hypothetical protein